MAAVWAEALDALSSIAKDTVPKNNQKPIAVTVRDEAGRVVFRAPLGVKIGK
jgi:hypothetical protein